MVVLISPSPRFQSGNPSPQDDHIRRQESWTDSKIMKVKTFIHMLLLLSFKKLGQAAPTCKMWLHLFQYSYVCSPMHLQMTMPYHNDKRLDTCKSREIPLPLPLHMGTARKCHLCQKLGYHSVSKMPARKEMS